MLSLQTVKAGMPTSQRQLSVGLAHTLAEVEAAQRLRYKIFAEEMGARLVSARDGIDCDHYDPFCDHLLVKDKQTGEVVGTYRMLPPEKAQEAGGLYSQSEFDLSRLAHILPNTVEVGRSCVHPDYRTGATIGLLWNGLANYMMQRGYGYLLGCASMSMADGGHNAANVYQSVKEKYLGPAEWRVFPNCPLPVVSLQNDLPPDVPALIKGYLRVGCYVCGDPAWDADFNTADLLVMLPMERMNHRYMRHFMPKSA